MATAGVNPKVVSEMLGHTSVAITLDRYSHVIPTMQAEAVRRLDGVLSGRLRVQMRAVAFRRDSKDDRIGIFVETGAVVVRRKFDGDDGVPRA